MSPSLLPTSFPITLFKKSLQWLLQPMLMLACISSSSVLPIIILLVGKRKKPLVFSLLSLSTQLTQSLTFKVASILCLLLCLNL